MPPERGPDRVALVRVVRGRRRIVVEQGNHLTKRHDQRIPIAACLEPRYRFPAFLLGLFPGLEGVQPPAGTFKDLPIRWSRRRGSFGDRQTFPLLPLDGAQFDASVGSDGLRRESNDFVSLVEFEKRKELK